MTETGSVQTFGLDVVLLARLVETGNQVGAGTWFYEALAFNSDLFQRVQEVVLDAVIAPKPITIDPIPLPAAEVEQPILAFNELLRLRRHKLRLSQTGIALRIGVKQQTIHRWEVKGDIPQRRFFNTLIEVLKVSGESFMASLRLQAELNRQDDLDT